VHRRPAGDHRLGRLASESPPSGNSGPGRVVRGPKGRE
jgi:hypothetical protein